MRASSKSTSETTAALRSELSEVKAANDELKRELRSNAAQLQELRDAQQSLASKSMVRKRPFESIASLLREPLAPLVPSLPRCAQPSSFIVLPTCFHPPMLPRNLQLAGSTASAEERIALLEQTVKRVEASQRETEGALNDGRFGQRQQVIENRQVTMERMVKQVEAKLSAFGEDLASRPLKTDVISAIAQQELNVEACASREQVEKLEAAIAQCAQEAKLLALEESVRLAQEQLLSAQAGIAETREISATKQQLAQRGKEIDALKQRLEEKVGREECNSLLASKLDKAEARSLLEQQERTAASAVGAEAHAKRLQDALSSMSNQALDAQGGVKQMSARMDKLSAMTNELEGRLNQRKAEVQSLTRVVRLILEDAEMQCAIDEAEGATAAEATDVLARLKGIGGKNAGGAPMHITGVTLHKQPGGPLTPMPPGAAAADKVWYKQTLQPRGDVLGARRRMLVNARHSWVGDACLARGEAEPSGSSDMQKQQLTPRPPDSGGPTMGSSPRGGIDCMHTPSSTGAAPEPPA